MKNRFFLAVIFLLLLGSLAGCFFYKKLTKRENGLGCYAHASFIYPSSSGSDRLELGMLFLLDKNVGIISYSGKINSTGVNYNVKRYAEVEYVVHDGTSYFIKTKAVHPDVSDNVPDVLSKKYFYDYLDRVDGWVSFRVVKDYHNKYTFYTNSIPHFVCKER